MVGLLAALALFASEPAEAEPVVEAYFEAFNAHDVETMGELLAPDATTVYLNEDGRSERVDGAEAVLDGLEDYFAALPDVRSEIEIIRVSGPQVLLDETVSWTDEDGRTRTRSAMAVYRVEAGRVEAVWYLPEVRE